MVCSLGETGDFHVLRENGAGRFRAEEGSIFTYYVKTRVGARASRPFGRSDFHDVREP